MANLPSRRAVLGGAVALPALAAAAVMVPAAADTAAWDRAIVAWNAARAAEQAYRLDVYDPAWAAVDREAPMVALTFTDTARDGSTGRFCVDPGRPDAWSYNPQLEAKARPIIAAYHKREAAERRHNTGSIDDEWSRLDDVVGEAEVVALLTPAPNLAALRWKIERLLDPEGECGGWRNDIVDALLADTRRLTGEVSA